MKFEALCIFSHINTSLVLTIQSRDQWAIHARDQWQTRTIQVKCFQESGGKELFVLKPTLSPTIERERESVQVSKLSANHKVESILVPRGRARSFSQPKESRPLGGSSFRSMRRAIVRFLSHSDLLELTPNMRRVTGSA